MIKKLLTKFFCRKNTEAIFIKSLADDILNAFKKIKDLQKKFDSASNQTLKRKIFIQILRAQIKLEKLKIIGATDPSTKDIYPTSATEVETMRDNLEAATLSLKTIEGFSH